MGKWPAICVLLLGCAAAFAMQDRTGKTGNDTPRGDVTRGKVVFDNNCDDCHDAYSKDERVGPGLKGIKDGKLPDGRKATHDQVLDIINTGPAEMTSFKDRLTEQEKEDVVAFVMTL
jgi:mono/diheme cytochrome c family protein